MIWVYTGREMADELWQSQLWDMSRRIGMQIAAMPADKREARFEVAERQMCEMVTKLGIATVGEGFVALQMQVVRETVEKIDAGGNPQGGNT